MRKYIELIIAAGVLLLLAGPALADLTIDQEQSVGEALMSFFVQTDLAQSFKPANDNVAGAGVFLYPYCGSTGDVRISLWDNLPNQGGNLLASGTAEGTPGNWVDVFWAPVTVAPGATLFLVFESTDSWQAIGGGEFDPYADGGAYANPGFESYADLGYDYAFRTYSESSVVVPIAIAIDIKPGSYPNSFNINGNGVIPVAVLGSDSFDVTQIDRSTLNFAGLAVRVKGNDEPLCSVKDVNGDGRNDLVCQFLDNPGTWAPGEGVATLTGQLLDGTQFAGTDSINVVP